MNTERIHYLLRQFMENELEPEENEEILAILRDDPGRVQEVIEGMLERQAVLPDFDGSQWDRLLERILDRGKPAPVRSGRPVRKLSVFRWASVAAVLLVGIGAYFILDYPSDHPDAPSARYQNDLPPGGNKAVLILSDGSLISLNEVDTGMLAVAGGTAVRKIEGGRLAYIHHADPSARQRPGPAAVHTIAVPAGGQYQLTLPDGSRVWLNASSSLTYPTSFTGKERKVKLEGEAYFEISSQEGKTPFTVSVAGVEITVLGTKFNLMAYKDESTIKTTLLEGSVLVSLTGRGMPAQARLKSGQEAQVLRKTGDGTPGKAIRVIRREVPGEAVAWKNGYFVFSKEPLRQVMRKVARWYDVEVDYQGELTRERFSGTISKYKNVSEVLDMLSLTDLVQFKIRERRITVMP